MALQWSALLFLVLLVFGTGEGGTFLGGLVDSCVCTPLLSTAPCCLKLLRSAVGELQWSVYSNDSSLKILDLSYHNITRIDMGSSDRGPPSLTELYLNHNRLTSLPKSFLSGLHNLTKINLEGNLLMELPPDFLLHSNNIQKLNLKGNQLQKLPLTILQKPNLLSLDLDDNPWDCSCEFLEDIELSCDANRTIGLSRLLANLTCASPAQFSGRVVLELSVREVCRPTGLTALFIVLPLLILSALVMCWCCGRTKSKKEIPAFSSKKKGANNHSNGHKPRPKPPPVSDQDPKPDPVQNQLLLRPSSALLSSTRDIYQDTLEVRLGSVDSLPQGGSLSSSYNDLPPAFQQPEGALEGAADLETVSVTEVMRDSTDREKAYLTHTTEYYSLVPGLHLDDSDHGEYENVELT